MLRITLFLAALTTSAFAQPAPTPPPEREVTVKLTESELVLMWRWVEKAPFAEVANFMSKLRAQVVPQLAPPAPAAPPPLVIPPRTLGPSTPARPNIDPMPPLPVPVAPPN